MRNETQGRQMNSQHCGVEVRSPVRVKRSGTDNRFDAPVLVSIPELGVFGCATVEEARALRTALVPQYTVTIRAWQRTPSHPSGAYYEVRA